MKKCISLINGKFKDSISVLDRGLAYGDGFFETMLWNSYSENNKLKLGVEFWKKHLQRIKKGCRLMKINFPVEKEILQQRNKILIESSKNNTRFGLLKMIITRGVGGRGYKFERNMRPTLIFLSFPRPKIEIKNYKKGVKVKLCTTRLSQNEKISGLKHLNRLDSVLARSEWNSSNIFEGVFMDSKKNILEGTMTNIFFVKKNQLFTPKIIDSGINGIMRQVVIENAKNFFDKVTIKDISINEISSFDQMFLTNSILKVLPVRSFKEKRFNILENVLNLVNFYNIANDKDKVTRFKLS